MAQNTSATYSPVVKPDDRSSQYRIAIGMESDRFSQRLHFQHALSDQFR